MNQWKSNQIDEFMFKHKYITELEDRGLTPAGVYALLSEVADKRDIVLCCYEKPNEFCHRHILAEWLGNGIKEL